MSFNFIYVSIFGFIFRSYVCESAPELDERFLYSLLGDNLYHTINNDLQEVINKLFSSMKLNVNFSEQYETRLLLSMFASLKEASEKTYDDIKQAKKLSRLDKTFNKFQNNSLFKLDAPIEEILAEDIRINNITIRQNSEVKLNMNSFEIPDDSKEAVILLREYLTNDQNVELADIERPSHKIKQIYEKHKQFRRAINRNFKMWDPTNTSEFEFETRRLYNGKQVKTKKYPFVASIHVRNQFVCTGAIISRDLVITAASCLNLVHYTPKHLQEYPSIMVVRVGSDYADKFGDVIDVINFYIYPKYEEGSLKNNIAILKIKKHIHLRSNTNKIRRIGYQHLRANLPDTVNEVLILGWGDEGGSEATKTKKETLSISTLDLMKNINDCTNIYTKKYITETNFCAGVTEKGTGACQHDIGGPAVVSSVLVGVVSFGPLTCGTPNAPTVFTNIGYYSDWIDSIVNSKSEEQMKAITASSIPSLNSSGDVNIEQTLNSSRYNLHDFLRLGVKISTPSSVSKIKSTKTTTTTTTSKTSQYHFTVAGDALEDQDDDDDDDEYTFAVKSEEMVSVTNSPFPKITLFSEISQIPKTAKLTKVLLNSSHLFSKTDYSDFAHIKFKNAVVQLSKSLRQILNHDKDQTKKEHDNNKSTQEDPEQGPELVFNDFEDQNEFSSTTSYITTKDILQNNKNVIHYTKGNFEVEGNSENVSNNEDDESDDDKSSDERSTLSKYNLSKKPNNLLTASTLILELTNKKNKRVKNKNGQKNSKHGLSKLDKHIKKTELVLMKNFVKVTQLSPMSGNNHEPKNIKFNGNNVDKTRGRSKYVRHKFPTKKKPLRTRQANSNKLSYLKTSPQIHEGIYSQEDIRMRYKNDVKTKKRASVALPGIEDLEKEIVRRLKIKNKVNSDSKKNTSKALKTIQRDNYNSKKVTHDLDNALSPLANRGLKIKKEIDGKRIRNKQPIRKNIGRSHLEHPEKIRKKLNFNKHTVLRGRNQKPTTALRYFSDSQDIANKNGFTKPSVSNISPVGMYRTVPYYEDYVRNDMNGNSIKKLIGKRLKELNEKEHYGVSNGIDYYYYLPSLEGGTSVMKDFFEIIEEIEAGGRMKPTSNNEDKSESFEHLIT